MIIKNNYLLLILFFLLVKQTHAQKVGLVLSGGGSKGLVHIGVLKALEENNIPIDYITGSSMGAAIGAMYAAGFTPEQIEQVALKKDFQGWVSGNYTSDYAFFFEKQVANASCLSLTLNADTSFKVSVKSDFVSDIPLNFALLELFSNASLHAKNDFDKLFVPFRCMVADIFYEKSITLKNGNLSDAIRGSMTVPLVYRPIKIDEKYVFDGGIYNNFPADVMTKEFNPDYMIGIDVTSKNQKGYPSNIDEKLLSKFLLNIFLSKTDSTLIGSNGMYIRPQLNQYSSTDFTPVAELIKIGYDATMQNMETIKAQVARRVSTEEITRKREAFNSTRDILFDGIVVSGVNSQQEIYIRRFLTTKRPKFTLKEIKRGYFKLVADETFDNIYPKILYNELTDTYKLEIIAHPHRRLKVNFGGNLSNRSISNLFLGLQYNFLDRKAYNFGANFYAGRFYESVYLTSRADFSTKLPFFINLDFTYNHLNYYNASEIFTDNLQADFIEQSDRQLNFKLGIPFNKNSRMIFSVGGIHNDDRYSPNNTFNIGDQLDDTKFKAVKTSLSFEKNNLNRKQYANRGDAISLNVNYIQGIETYRPGNIISQANVGLHTEANRNWFSAKFSNENYFHIANKYALGYLVEGVVSNQPFFSNYYSTLLAMPAFYPLSDSKSLFLKKLRSNSYAAGGIKSVFTIRKNLDFRLEGYLYFPYKEFEFINKQDIAYGKSFSTIHYASTAGLVYNTVVGPISLSYNLYDDKENRSGVLFHIGYLIYNKRSLE